MRTLYSRIIITTMFIMIMSAIIAFFATNIYYHAYLKSKNDEKVTEIAESIVKVIENGPGDMIDLATIANLGYSFYLIDENGQEQLYGDQFKVQDRNIDQIEFVLAGNVYHGIKHFPWKPFVTGFFDNELSNTIGVPVQVGSDTTALFVRPNTAHLFGEMRKFLAVLLLVTLLFSFLFVLLSTRFIVNPLKKLTEATKKIAAGNYHLKLNLKRRDEIGRLANDFSVMSENLAATEQKRQDFVSSVSHEIQSPLTSIQGFSRVLREQELTDEKRLHYLSIIEKESSRLSMLSKQLLTLSFLDSETNNLEKTPFDLSTQLKEVVLAQEWIWREKDLTLEINVPSLFIYAEKNLLNQVWLNLINNAVQYTNDGGTIMILAVARKTNVEVVFKDTGIGISRKDLSQLFDRFYIADKARTRTKTSTGLGLSIVKKIIELHGGTITVESELDEGTTFTVVLPK